MNDKFVHVSGPFTANSDVVSYIKSNYDSDMKYIKKCGIQSEVGNFVNINGQKFEIGKTGILELNDVKITSLYFSQDEPASSLVDGILE
ncbi:MAG: hypothetical protein LIO71_02965 [Ruminococcus sp.]|nr:hypothetical protein [Ruminococcus sp.]